jgi:hypothetical protein
MDERRFNRIWPCLDPSYDFSKLAARDLGANRYRLSVLSQAWVGKELGAQSARNRLLAGHHQKIVGNSVGISAEV